LTILRRIAAQQPVLLVMEDLHWVDPSTLEFLSLLVDQGPTARILALCTFRPDFRPPWTGRSHLTQVTLPRLPGRQAAAMADRVAHGKALPAEVMEQIVAKTDGVPLFVEELTKMVLESGLLQEREERYALTGPLLPLAIPTTLHGSLMARLDRLATVKALAQLGATLGREFSYALLRAVAPWDEVTVRRGLQQLVEAEFLYQQGLPPQATYTFKHALIQDTAYQSLLKRTRQQYHQRIAQVLETQFPETAETQPELLAQHYTEAGRARQAIPHWQRAGERANERSANVEAISHLTTALELLQTLPDTPERRQQELTLLTALGTPLVLTKGHAAPEVEATYAQARALCQQRGDAPQLFAALLGLRRYYQHRGELALAHELGEELLRLAERCKDAGLLVRAHMMLAEGLLWLGAFTRAHAHAEQGIALYDPQEHRVQVLHYGNDPGVCCRSFAALALWVLGYADQAQRRSEEALAWAQELAHPFSLAFALVYAARFHQFRREPHHVHAWAEAALALSRERGFAQFLATASMLSGWARAEQGQGAAGLAQIRQGLAAYQATGAPPRPYELVLLAGAYGLVGQPEEGFAVVAEAVAAGQKSGDQFYQVERHRLTGELLLARFAEDHAAAEACFQQALDVARRQQAKSLELRAAMSLSRLWQQQGKQAEAHALLAPVYGWFTEGFDTADLQEAKALLEDLGG
jgi:predicted ATPase